MAESAPPDTRMEAMVEAAARALLCKPHTPLALEWQQVSEHARGEFRAEAKVALEAAGVPALLGRLDAAEAVCDELARALLKHRADMHNPSDRPCPTCARSAKALDAWRALREQEGPS